MKRLFILLLTLLPVMAYAQDQDEPLDSTDIPVIAYFSVNDSTEYTETNYKCMIVGNDTTDLEYYEYKYMLTVTDTTSSGYVIEFTPLQCAFLSNQPTLRDYSAKRLWDNMGRITFYTDECGGAVNIKDWQKVRDMLLSAYAKSLGIQFDIIGDSIINRNALLGLMATKLQTEESLLNELSFTSQLFGLHGRAFSTDEKVIDELTLGYPSKLHIVAFYEDEETKKYYDDDNGSEDDYFVRSVLETSIPTKDAMNLAADVVSIFVNDDKFKDPTKMKDEIASASKEMGDMSVVVTNTLGYFSNGWPKLSYQKKQATAANMQKVEIISTDWTKIRWK